ncbi:MAG: hypothetical protein AB7W16_18395 [Candidatus Obscuribacterales bacterium]
MKFIGLISVLALALFLVQDPALAAEGANYSSETPSALQSPVFKFTMAFLSNAIPWIVGFACDLAILKKFLSWKNTVLTALVAFVLAYPSIFFALPALIPFVSKSELEWLAIIVFGVVLTIAISCVKVIGYWVINEGLPNKLVAALLVCSAAALTGTSYLVSILK